MNLSDLKRIDKLPHLSDYTVEKLITEKSLYEGILITTTDIDNEPGVELDNTNEVWNIVVSKDVKALHSIFNSTESILLPCPYCNEKRPFSRTKGWNPLATKKKVITDSDIPIFIESETTK